MQHTAWVIAPLVLVGVLAFSAVTKFGKGELLRKIVRNLHLPDALLPVPLARAIPGIELALVAGLLTPWLATFTVAAGATLVLMVVYWALIARGLTITPRPACGCFGQAGDHRISGRTLLRNTLLVAAAGAAVGLAGSGRTVWSVLSNAGPGDWLWLGCALVACAVTALVLGAKVEVASPPVWQEPDVDLTAETLAPVSASDGEEDEDDYVRRPTPELLLHDPESGPVTLPELSAKRAQLLIFVNCYCASTTEVITLIEGWQEDFTHADLRLVFSVPIAGRFVGNVPPGTLVDHAAVAWRRLGLEDSPSALLLGADGHLAGGPVHGIGEVHEFVEDVRDALREAVASVDDVSQE